MTRPSPLAQASPPTNPISLPPLSGKDSPTYMPNPPSASTISLAAPTSSPPPQQQPQILSQSEVQQATASNGTPPLNPGVGTCPGDGRCDGTGGSSACAGCPTFNNALAISARQKIEASPAAQESEPVPAQTQIEANSPETPPPDPPSGDNESPAASELWKLRDEHNASLEKGRRWQ